MMNFPQNIGVFPYRPACVLKVSGADAGAFLQGQFTNDLSRMAPLETVYGLWLDRKGRVIADSHVVRSADAADYWVVGISSPSPTVVRRLEDFIIADEVVVEDLTASWAGVSLIGAGAGEWLFGEVRGGLRFPGRRGLEENWEWIHPWADSSAVAAAVGSGRPLSGLDMERLRIAAGIPSVPADIGPSDLPNEGGLDSAAISYSKGCYLGQEVMARVKSLGRVRRALVAVAGAGAPPQVPAALWAGERKEGELRSAVAAEGGGFAGLALVSVSGAAAGGPLALSPSGEPGVRLVRKS
jgi:tRNA-modifying protein YgfZ